MVNWMLSVGKWFLKRWLHADDHNINGEETAKDDVKGKGGETPNTGKGKKPTTQKKAAIAVVKTGPLVPVNKKVVPGKAGAPKVPVAPPKPIVPYSKFKAWWKTTKRGYYNSPVSMKRKLIVVVKVFATFLQFLTSVRRAALRVQLERGGWGKGASLLPKEWVRKEQAVEPRPALVAIRQRAHLLKRICRLNAGLRVHRFILRACWKLSVAFRLPTVTVRGTRHIKLGLIRDTVFFGYRPKLTTLIRRSSRKEAFTKMIVVLRKLMVRIFAKRRIAKFVDRMLMRHIWVEVPDPTEAIYKEFTRAKAPRKREDLKDGQMLSKSEMRRRTMPMKDYIVNRLRVRILKEEAVAGKKHMEAWRLRMEIARNGRWRGGLKIDPELLKYLVRGWSDHKDEINYPDFASKYARVLKEVFSTDLSYECLIIESFNQVGKYVEGFPEPTKGKTLDYLLNRFPHGYPWMVDIGLQAIARSWSAKPLEDPNPIRVAAATYRIGWFTGNRRATPWRTMSNALKDNFKVIELPQRVPVKLWWPLLCLVAMSVAGMLFFFEQVAGHHLLVGVLVLVSLISPLGAWLVPSLWEHLRGAEDTGTLIGGYNTRISYTGRTNFDQVDNTYRAMNWLNGMGYNTYTKVLINTKYYNTLELQMFGQPSDTMIDNCRTHLKNLYLSALQGGSPNFVSFRRKVIDNTSVAYFMVTLMAKRRDDSHLPNSLDKRLTNRLFQSKVVTGVSGTPPSHTYGL